MGLRACRGYGPLPPLPLDRGGIIHQRCRLHSDRQRRVTLYSDPEPTAEIKKDGAPWSVDELIETVPLPCSRTWSPRRRATLGMLFAVRGDRADEHTAVSGTPPETRRAAGATTR